MSRLEQQRSSQHRRPGAAQEAAAGDPLLDHNPYFCEAVCRSAQVHRLVHTDAACQVEMLSMLHPTSQNAAPQQPAAVAHLLFALTN